MTSFDIIGFIAVLHTLKAGKKEKKIAKSLIKKHRNIKSVYAQSKIKGRLRTPKLKWLAGKKDSKAIHKESNCIMKLDLKTCYFSPRLSTDRLNIAKKVKKGENILVMFSGVAPYGLVIAKHSKAKQIVCIEISKKASKYAKENVKANKLTNIKIIQGDVKLIVPKIKEKLR